MTSRSSNDELRRRAEARLDPEPGGVRDLTMEEAGALIQELRTHQVELEIQNEDLRATQHELVEARDRFVDLYDFGPVGYVTLSVEGRILEANLVLARLLNEERAALLGRSLLEWAASEADADTIWKHCHTPEAKPGDHWHCDVQLKKEAELVWVRIESEQIRDPESQELQTRSAIIDISEQRAADEERGRVEQQLFRMRKLESLGVLAGGIAHDFNNLLTVILGHASLILEESPPDSSVRLDALRIVQSAKLAADLCQQMLSYGRSEPSHIEPIELSQLARKALRMMDVSIAKNVRFHLHFESGLPCIEGDATQLRQVMMNLVTNASEAMSPGGGLITVTTGRVSGERVAPAGDSIGPGIPHEGDGVYLEVSDTGRGIDASERARIFDPYFSTKFSGRGLGLFSVLGIVRAHGGTIVVRSEVGTGTSIRVFFPAAAKTELRKAAREDSVPERLAGIVLVVDDEPEVCSYAARVLGKAGCEVLKAANGTEALAVYKARSSEIAVVLLDLTMPGLGGIEVFRLLRKIRPDVCAVLTSGYGEATVHQELDEAASPSGFLPKPFTPKQLVRAIAQAMPSGGAAPARPPGASSV